MPSLDIIIVNWNGGALLGNCLRSLVVTTRDGWQLHRVILVDNASLDTSLDEVGSLELPLTIIHNRENRGFAAACNQGAKGSRADFLLFLNPDTWLRPHNISNALHFYNSSISEDVGIVGIQLRALDGTSPRTCAKFPTPSMFCFKSIGLNWLIPKGCPGYIMPESDHVEDGYVDHVMGAFYLVRREVFDELGGFDERFFVYLEDLDFSLRASRTGWKTYYQASNEATHIGGGCSKLAKAERLYYFLYSQIVYARKHFSYRAALIVTITTLLIEPWARIVWAIVRLAMGEIVNTAKAYTLLWNQLIKATSRTVITRYARPFPYTL